MNETNAMIDVMKAADHAAQQSDRWMFMFMFILMVIGGGFFWRWIIADREKLTARSNSMTDLYITTVKELSNVVANNTAALTEFKKTTEICSRHREHDNR